MDAGSSNVVQAEIDRRALKDKLRSKLHTQQLKRKPQPTKAVRRQQSEQAEETRSQSVEELLKTFNVDDPEIKRKLISSIRSGDIKNLSQLSQAIAKYLDEMKPPQDIAREIQNSLVSEAQKVSDDSKSE